MNQLDAEQIKRAVRDRYARAAEGAVEKAASVGAVEGAAEKAYTGRPAATAVVDLEGKIAFHSVGPGGAKPKQADKVIKRLIAKGGFPTTRPTSGPATKPTRRPAAGSTTRPAAKPTTRPATAVKE